MITAHARFWNGSFGFSTAGTEAVDDVFEGSTTVVSLVAVVLVCCVEGEGDDDDDANRRDCSGIEDSIRDS